MAATSTSLSMPTKTQNMHVMALKRESKKHSIVKYITSMPLRREGLRMEASYQTFKPVMSYVDKSPLSSGNDYNAAISMFRKIFRKDRSGESFYLVSVYNPKTGLVSVFYAIDKAGPKETEPKPSLAPLHQKPPKHAASVKSWQDIQWVFANIVHPTNLRLAVNVMPLPRLISTLNRITMKMAVPRNGASATSAYVVGVKKTVTTPRSSTTKKKLLSPPKTTTPKRTAAKASSSTASRYR